VSVACSCTYSASVIYRNSSEFVCAISDSVKMLLMMIYRISNCLFFLLFLSLQQYLMYLIRSNVRGGLFCSTLPAVPAFRMTIVNICGRNILWKIKDESIDLYNVNQQNALFKLMSKFNSSCLLHVSKIFYSSSEHYILHAALYGMFSVHQCIQAWKTYYIMLQVQYVV
jgi:hypothetical protein